jgi:hypothetical protein
MSGNAMVKEMSINTADGPGTLCVLLAGHRAMRPGVSVAHDVGIPVAALPIDANRSLCDAWDDLVSGAGVATRRLLAVTHESERRFYLRGREGQTDGSAGVSPHRPHGDLCIVVDRADHRGAAGTIADLVDLEAADGRPVTRGVFVLETSSLPDFDLTGFSREVGRVRDLAGRQVASADIFAVVGAAPAHAGSSELRPAGVFYLSSGAIALVPRVGYFDLKEQLLAAISSAGGMVRAWVGADRFSRVVGRESYLEAIRFQLERGAPARAGDVRTGVRTEIRGCTVACRGVELGDRALVVDSAVLPGARIGKGAIVARSVIPPGAVVPDGAFVVDQVFASLGAAEGAAR